MGEDHMISHLKFEEQHQHKNGGGWVGDNPHVMLDTRKIRSLGWAPTVPVREAIERTVDYLLSSECDYL